MGKRKFEGLERQIRVIYYSPEDQPGFESFHEPSYYAFVNSQPVSDGEDEYLLPRSQSSVIIDRLDIPVRSNLAEAMFLAAVSNPIANCSRFFELLERKKHLLISAQVKAKVINGIIEFLPETGVAQVELPWLVVLIEGLATSGFLPLIDGGHLLRAFTCRPVMEVILRANRDIFKQKITLDHLVKLIEEHSDYYLVETLLILRVDASDQEKGISSLDHLSFANIDCQSFVGNFSANIPSDFNGSFVRYYEYCEVIESERLNLIRLLENQICALKLFPLLLH